MREVDRVVTKDLRWRMSMFPTNRPSSVSPEVRNGLGVFDKALAAYDAKRGE